jgi:Tol biopolymer transport system component
LIADKLRSSLTVNRLRALLIGGGILLLVVVAVSMLAWRTTSAVKPTQPCEGIDPDASQNGNIVFDLADYAAPIAADPEGMGLPEPLIWTISPDGSNQAQFTTDSRYVDENPAWSPDGRQIAFARTDRDDPPGLAKRLYVMNSDCSNKTELPLPTWVGAYDLTWSPDGDRIAFWNPSDGTLYMTHTDGSGTLRKLSTPGLAGAARPAWSPGGSQIAFQSVGKDSWADIYVITISPEGETSELRPITEYSTSYAEEPAWSPDGTEIAFTRRGDIYKIDVNSLRETRLTSSTQNSHYSQPTWSPDGKQIAYVKEWYSGTQAAALYKMNSDGSNPIPVFEVKGKYAYHPDWGPRP